MPPSTAADLLLASPHGLFVPAAGLHLDAKWAPGTVFVSHAHADHCSRAERIVCTPETAALHEARRGRRDVLAIPYGVPTPIGDAEIVLHSAAHCLGAAMIEVRTRNGVLVYTGDFKLRPNPFAPPSSIPRCDVLVTECTFGEPRYVFPPDDDLIAALYAFVDAALTEGATPVVLAYALGKGQEALFHLTRRGYDVVLHGAIANMCQLHVELGHPFPGPGTWSRYRRGEVGQRVLLTTPSTRKTAMVQGLPSRRIAYLTGWAYHPGAHNIYKGIDLVLPLSDHADYDELVRTARESGAAKVYTVHGPASFAERLRALGIDAEHLGAHPQDLDDDEGFPGAVQGTSRQSAQHSLDL
ncbi:MAG: MBL fold metallo-hydrolase [Gemmatimonadaceae bacterium]